MNIYITLNAMVVMTYMFLDPSWAMLMKGPHMAIFLLMYNQFM